VTPTRAALRILAVTVLALGGVALLDGRAYGDVDSAIAEGLEFAGTLPQRIGLQLSQFQRIR
jgi:hypothetical protein